MKIEHVALQVDDPIAMAKWYRDHLGFSIVRSMDQEPYTTFIADGSGKMLIEIYRQKSQDVPDYRGKSPFLLHIAFSSQDVEADARTLVAAGASPEWKKDRTPAGDDLLMLRDPWGFAIQLVRRQEPMV